MRPSNVTRGVGNTPRVTLVTLETCAFTEPYKGILMRLYRQICPLSKRT